MSITVKKSTAERYTLVSKDPYWWADITVSSDGFLNIQSDYGDFSYRWGAFGDDFKAFLIDCDNSYISKKIGRNYPDVFNAKKTEMAFKRDIIEARKNRIVTAEQAREAWDELKLYGIYNMYDLHKISKDIYENDFSAMPCIKDTNYSLVAFLERCWPVFMEEIKKELVEA